MLAIILIGVAGVLVLIVAIAARRPSAYHVERKLEVAAPADRVWGVASDLRQFGGVLVLFGSPWDKGDPDQGKMTLERSVRGEHVSIKLDLVKPMKSTVMCALTLAATPTGSLVTWSMDGHHNLIGRVLGMFVNMDNLLAKDIEKGLALLKIAAEGV